MACKRQSKDGGFTLSELLIALVILGLIATFTIPKVLSSQQDSRNKSIVKEAAAMLSQALELHRQSGQLSASTRPSDLYQYMNYVKLDSAATTVIDNEQGLGTQVCNNSYPCIWLHSGAIMMGDNTTFGGTAPTDSFLIDIDADGKVTAGGAANGPGKSVPLRLYYSGRITDAGGSIVPPWFNWD